MFGFEQLEVWGKTIDFANTVYSLTRESDDPFDLSNQMRRAVVSISSNITECGSKRSPKDSVRFVEVAAGSLFEVVSQSFILRDRGLLTPEGFQVLYAAAAEQGRMLGELRRSLSGDS